PLWVNNGHRGELKQCPLYPQKADMTTIQYEVWSYLKADIGGGPGGSVTFSKSLNQYGVGLSRAKAVGSIVVLFRDVRIAVMKWIILPASETKEKRADEHSMLGDKDFTAPWHPARLCKAPPCPDGKKRRRKEIGRRWRGLPRHYCTPFPSGVLSRALSRPFIPPTPRPAIDSYWRAHPIRADRLARGLAARSGAPAGWTWRHDA